jgi:DNA polymerase-3 subunit delta'
MSFREIKGNSYPIEFLRYTFLNQKIASVYLFYGQEGIGKKLIAHNLAKAINCFKRDNFDSCDECSSCKKIDRGNHSDIFYILPNSLGSIGIDEIRLLKERVYLKTYEAKKKIFIIDDAEKLTLQAANACLKVLEEPVVDSLIILITSKPKLILPTILSRCYKIGFSPLDKKELKRILMADFKLEQTLAHYLAYFCEGRIGKAIRLSRQPDILSYKNRIIEEFVFPSSVYDNKEIKRERLKETLEILLSWFRDLYMIKSGVLVEELINIDLREQIVRYVQRYSLDELEEMINFICEAILFLDKNINPKLLWSNLKIRTVR